MKRKAWEAPTSKDFRIRRDDTCQALAAQRPVPRKSSTTALFLDKPTHLTDIPAAAPTVGNIPTTQRPGSICGHGRRPRDAHARHLHPQSSPCAFGGSESRLLQGRTTPRAPTAQAASEQYRLAGAVRVPWAVHVPWWAEVF